MTMNLGALRVAVRPLITSLATTRQKLFSPKLLLYTNTALSVSMSITGDLMQQWYHANNKHRTVAWDQTRTIRVAAAGLIIGPFVHYWYVFLDRWLPGRGFRVLCKKVLLDQIVCSPVYLSLFMLSLCLMENKSWSEMKKSFVDKGSMLYVAEWVVWPPAQFINFYFLPTKYRVLYDNTISLAFDCFWSYVWFEMESENEDTESGRKSESQKVGLTTKSTAQGVTSQNLSVCK